MSPRKNEGLRKVAFDALIYEIKNRSCKDGHKVTRLVLEFPSSDLTTELNQLNDLQDATRYVSIGIVERPQDEPKK